MKHLAFVSIDGDNIGQLVGRLSQNDDVEGIRKVAHEIDRGNQAWASWAVAAGGELIEAGGDECRLMVPTDKLGEIPNLRDTYKSATGHTCSVGVGVKLSEADKALLAAKLRGKDRVVFWSPEVDQELEKVRKEHAQTEQDKVWEEYLGPLAKEEQVGRHLPMRPQKPAPQATTQHDHSAAGVVREQVADQPSPPERTHAAADFEEQFHQEASKQQASDQIAASQQNDQREQLKQQVAATLQQLKQVAPVLSELRQASPESYDAVMAMSQCMVGLARALVGPEQPQSVAKHEPDTADSLDEEKVGREGVHLDVDSSLGKVETCPHCGKSLKMEKDEGGLGRRLHLPVGTRVDTSSQGVRGWHQGGKQKIEHGDGGEGWVSMRSGMVRSRDGHPISARNQLGRAEAK